MKFSIPTAVVAALLSTAHTALAGASYSASATLVTPAKVTTSPYIVVYHATTPVAGQPGYYSCSVPGAAKNMSVGLSGGTPNGVTGVSYSLYLYAFSSDGVGGTPVDSDTDTRLVTLDKSGAFSHSAHGSGNMSGSLTVEVNGNAHQPNLGSGLCTSSIDSGTGGGGKFAKDSEPEIVVNP